jgi:hypothetical protein
MALFVGMASLALPRPRDTSSLVIDPKLAAAPREKVEHVFGWHIFPRALLVYLIFVAASGAMIEWLALKPPGLLAFPVATAVFYLLPLVLVFAYGVLSFLKVEQMYPASSLASTATTEQDESSVEVLSRIDPVPSIQSWVPNYLFFQNSILQGLVVGSAHTVASNLYELSDKSSCETFSAERSSVTDFYWGARCLACMMVGYSIDRARRRVQVAKVGTPESMVLRHLGMISLVMAAALISTLIFRATAGYCFSLPFLLISAGLAGGAMGGAFTMMPLLITFVSGGNAPDASFGFSLGMVSTGPVAGIIVLYALVSPFVNTYIWSSCYAAACLGAAWNSNRLANLAFSSTAEQAGFGDDTDTKPLLG